MGFHKSLLNPLSLGGATWPGVVGRSNDLHLQPPTHLRSQRRLDETSKGLVLERIVCRVVCVVPSESPTAPPRGWTLDRRRLGVTVRAGDGVKQDYSMFFCFFFRDFFWS